MFGCADRWECNVPGCVLRAHGSDFDVDGYLASSPFQPCAVFHRGEPRSPTSARLCDTNGFNLVVSDGGGNRVPVQIRDAATFVAAHRVELARRVAWPGVEAVTLDFGWDFPYARVAGQYNYFPPALLAACGVLGLGIEVSVYAASGEETGGHAESP
jgi:hypothetical protein